MQQIVRLKWISWLVTGLLGAQGAYGDVQARIQLQPEQISGLGDPQLLVNEQFVPVIEGTNPAPAPLLNPRWEPSWNDSAYPVSATINLGEPYRLSKVGFFDSNNNGKVDFEVGSQVTSGISWQPVVSSLQADYNLWKLFPFKNASGQSINLLGQYLRITIHKANVSPSEIALYGEPVNQSPIVTVVPSATMTFQETRTVAVSATDPDGDALTFSLIAAPKFVALTNITSHSAQIQINSNTAENIGQHSITVSVKDQKNALTTRVLNLAVTKIPNPKCDPVATVAPNTTTPKQMATALGKGVNLGGYLEGLPFENSWSDHSLLGETIFKKVSEAGFCTIRLPVRWSSHAANTSPYTIDTAFFQRVDFAIKMARGYGMNIIVDMHHYRQLSNDPLDEFEVKLVDANNNPVSNTILEDRFVSMWQQIAKRYANYDQQVLFELLNEPGSRFKLSNPVGTPAGTPSTLSRLYARALEQIRAANPGQKRFVLLAPANVPYHMVGEYLNKVTLPQDRSDIIATVHNYEPFNFTHAGFPAVTQPVDICCDAQQISSLKVTLDAASTWGKEKNVPIYIGEFGVHRYGSTTARLNYLRVAVAEMNARGQSWAYWAMVDDWYLYSAKNNAHSWNEEFKNVLMGQ